MSNSFFHVLCFVLNRSHEGRQKAILPHLKMLLIRISTLILSKNTLDTKLMLYLSQRAQNTNFIIYYCLMPKVLLKMLSKRETFPMRMHEGTQIA